MFEAAKVAAAVVGGGLAALWAQTELPNIGVDTTSVVGLIGLLAILVGRYTFRQLEDYRGDIKSVRERNEALEDDLRKAGQARAVLEARNRELEAYAHRLQLWAASVATGVELPQLPDPPAAPARFPASPTEPT